MVDKFISYSENVNTVQEAFSFIMQYMDEFESPDIDISPYKSYESLSDLEDETSGEVKFAVSVSGNVE